ncbi:hypothetical protein GQ53DRAFT_759111 [Thozetella sp. PMI_491]|nr:hypothetical protein GQ53DRAFT_759111 [Thozetella sp. PMI_491]
MFVSSAILVSTLAFAKTTLADGQWCHFWTEDACEKKSGGVSYDIYNDGIFQNGGPYFTCNTAYEFSLISYPPGDSDGKNPKHCHVFPQYPVYDSQTCVHLDDLGFTTGDGGYYRLSFDKTCPSTSDKREADNLDASKRDVDKRESLTARREQRRKVAAEKIARNSNYLGFYDDPGCQERSGSVDYSTSNQGCFENGGAYVKFTGDDTDWHLEQWTGIDNYKCAETMENCKRMGEIGFPDDTGYKCVHLDDFGFHTGFGSYKIDRAGCP